MKNVFVVIFFLTCTGLFSLSAETEKDWAPLEANALPSEWRDFQERIAERPWAVAEFVEKRFFPFRVRPVELEGTVWYGRQEGLTLDYHSPRREVVRVDQKGVRIIQSEGQSRDREIPEEGREIPSTLLALFRLDFAELEKDFELEGWRDGYDWGLRLTPRELEKAPVRRIELSGDIDDVRNIALEQTSRRRIELELLNPEYPSVLDAEARARVFP